MYTVSNSRRRRMGVSLIEAMAAVALLSLGLIATIAGLGAMSRTESRLRQVETMTSMAQHKYDELVATSTNLNTSQSGDFSDQNNPTYKWDATVDQTGVDSLIALTVTVSSTVDTASNAPKGTVTGILYQPPNATGGSATPGQ